MIFEETIKFLNEILYFLLYMFVIKINKLYIYIYILHKPNLKKLFKRICEYFCPLLYIIPQKVYYTT